jgi:hypothetical protein
MRVTCCYVCNRPSGFARRLGWGTFFMVILTAGFWLLTIPFYPKRCTTCGCTEGGAARASLALADGSPRRERQLLTAYGVIGAFVLVVLLIWLAKLGSPDKPASTPATHTAVETVGSPVVAAEAEDHNVHISANYFGGNPLSDGRTYSVYTLAVYQNKIPLHTELFVQGRIAQFVLGMIVLEDEKEPSMRMACFAKNQDEYYDIQRYYPIGTTVQVSGEYAGDSARVALTDQKVFEGRPVLNNCIAAGATEDDKVVRPAQAPEMSRPVPASPASPQSSSDANIHLHYSGGVPVSDGRTYSVALIDANASRLPVNTPLFVQGAVFAFSSGTTLVLRDEYTHAELGCNVLNADVYKAAQRDFPVDHPVKVFGKYLETFTDNPTINGAVLFGNCTVASPTDNVVRNGTTATAVTIEGDSPNHRVEVDEVGLDDEPQFVRGGNQEREGASGAHDSGGARVACPMHPRKATRRLTFHARRQQARPRFSRSVGSDLRRCGLGPKSLP